MANPKNNRSLLDAPADGLPVEQRKRLFAFYSTGALREIIPIYPLYSVMFIANGINALELSLLFIIWATVGLVFEVPSGALADKFSRKWLVVLSGLLKCFAFISWFMWQNFAGYAAGFILWGIGSSLRSGAYEALLYESLQSWNRSASFNFHFGRIRALSTICVLLGEASGGLLISYGFDTVLLISAAVPVLATLPFLLYVKDIDIDHEHPEHGLLREGFLQARQNKTVLMILVVTTFLLTVHGIFDEYVPPLFQEHGFSLAMIAFLAIPVFSAQALGEFLADRLEHLSFNAQINIIVLAVCFLVPAAYFQNWISVVSLTVFFLCFGISSTLLETKLQHAIEGRARATVTSIIGLGDSIGAIIWFAIFGSIAQWYSFSTATIFLAFATLLLSLAIRQYRFNIN